MRASRSGDDLFITPGVSLIEKGGKLLKTKDKKKPTARNLASTTDQSKRVYSLVFVTLSNTSAVISTD